MRVPGVYKLEIHKFNSLLAGELSTIATGNFDGNLALPARATGGNLKEGDALPAGAIATGDFNANLQGDPGELGTIDFDGIQEVDPLPGELSAGNLRGVFGDPFPAGEFNPFAAGEDSKVLCFLQTHTSLNWQVLHFHRSSISGPEGSLLPLQNPTADLSISVTQGSSNTTSSIPITSLVS